MQFDHAHGFRPQVGQVLEQEWPEAQAAWLALGSAVCAVFIVTLAFADGARRLGSLETREP